MPKNMMNQQYLTRNKLYAFPKLLLPLLIVIVGCISCNYEPPRIMSKMKQNELEKAIFFAEANLSSLGDAGYVEYTPTVAATQLVETMNAAQTLTPEEEEEFRRESGGRKPSKPIPYVLDKPIDKWLVVVIGDEENQQVIMEGYDMDLTKPVITKNSPCCSF